MNEGILKCDMDPIEGYYDCTGFGEECTWDTFESRCEGDAILECEGGKVAAWDCSVVEGGTCKEFIIDGESYLGCAGVGPGCDTATYVDTCKGDTAIKFCHSGEIDTFECTSIGYSRCTQPADDNGHARCSD
jgi:hypothetical protein